MLLIQCVILCAFFTFAILPPQFKNPLSQIVSYPPAIRERVANLPQYKDILDETKKKNIARKIIGTLISVVALAFLAFFSGKQSFLPAFYHVFLLFFVVNMYDLLILDFIVFRHSKKVIIPGTEDMIEEYKKPMHHVKGAMMGLVFGVMAASLAGVIVELIKYFLN